MSPLNSKGQDVQRQSYDDIRDALTAILRRDHGITTSRYHGRPYRWPCHLIHQDNLEKRRAGGKLPQCHPNFGKSERDFEGEWLECDLTPDMPKALEAGVDHEDTWWRGDRMVAAVWYPYDVPLDRLGEAYAHAARHGLELTLATGWGAHYYGNTPALILTLRGAGVPDAPRTEDLIREARKLHPRSTW